LKIRCPPSSGGRIYLTSETLLFKRLISPSGQHLQTLPDDIFQPLNSLIKLPRFLDSGNSPRDYDFHPLQPSLQLFLSGNSMRTLPSSMFNLHNISVLSLRNNDLSTLPPLIGKLQNLVELNIAGNRLESLPWELLSIIRSPKIRTLTVLPNPLMQPFVYDEAFVALIGEQFTPDYLSGDISLRIKEIKGQLSDRKATQRQGNSVDVASPREIEQLTWMLELYTRYLEHRRRDHEKTEDPDEDMNHTPLFIASTPVTRFNIDGSLPMDLRQSAPPSHTPQCVGILPAIPGGAQAGAPGGNRVPSLLELAAVSASTVPQLPILHTLLPEDAPAPVVRALETACRAREEGGRTCSVCGRNYIIPRTQWVEYWHVPPKMGQRSCKEEMFWPFLRRGCSPGCVPARHV
jgi:hypothetical protein